MKSPRFLTIVLGGVMLVIGNALTLGSFYGTNTYPLTYKVLDVVSGLFGVFVLIVTAIYTGELVWRERDARMDDIGDSMPAPTWLAFLAKLATILALQALLLCVVMACSIAVQLLHGFTQIEIGQYLFELFVLQYSSYLLIAVLALIVHTVVNNKYLGHFVVGLVFLVFSRLPAFGFEDRLYLYGSSPGVVYSDLNGYGHFLPALFWFRALLARLRDAARRPRLRALGARPGTRLAPPAARRGGPACGRRRWRSARPPPRPSPPPAAGSSTTPMSSTRSRAATRRSSTRPSTRSASRRWTARRSRASPRSSARRPLSRGEPRAHRRHADAGQQDHAPIRDLYVSTRPRRSSMRCPSTLPRASPTRRATCTGITTCSTRRWRPGADRLALRHRVRGARLRQRRRRPGGARQRQLPERRPDAGDDADPELRLQAEAELSSDRDRKDFGLAPRPRMKDLDDPAGRLQNGLSRDADFIDYRATFCTAADQLPVTSGYVERDWSENGRRCIAYRMDSKMADVYSFVSARYAVRRDVWHGPGGDVAIEIDYQRGHEYNLERMVAGVRDSLAYFTAHYGPYQHKILRIIEFPRFSRGGGFAESFPNTVPFNEAIGFTAKVDDDDPQDIDYPYFITAHEVAHQWWAHQEVPAAVQGGEFITESLSEYSALMVLKQKYGDAKMRRFLKYELDRYLLGRGTETKQEQPLVRADGAAYVHYQKGALALYALQDAIGEAAMDDALSAFVKRWRFAGPPYARSVDLLAEFRRVTPAPLQPLIADLFETITLYDVRAVSASAVRQGDGSEAVEVVVTAKKIRADGAGNETEVPFDGAVDIGALDAKGNVVAIEKRQVKSGREPLHAAGERRDRPRRHRSARQADRPRRERQHRRADALAGLGGAAGERR